MVIVALVLSLGMVALPAGEVRAGGADVFIDPTLKEVATGETFTVNVDIIPGESIAGAQFDMSFDQSRLYCNGVTEGDLFSQDGADTFFGVINIDNGGGTITGVYGGTLYGATVSGPGTFATVSFTAKDVLGTSLLNFSNVGVADPTPAWLLSITVTDGSVTTVLLGDANGDGNINVLDMTKVARIILLLDAETPGADANLDGVVNVLDITKIARIILGLD